MSEQECGRQLTLKEVLLEAVKKELESHIMYLDLKQRVVNPSAQDALQELAQQEKTHQSILEDYLVGRLKEGALDAGVVVDYKIAEYLEQPVVSPAMELSEVFLLAANKEKRSHDLYLNLAALHPNGQVKKLLQDLASQELNHKLKVETLFNETAFPQTDGG
jgi:rubrerythrin